jgi:hypothetical protein
METTSVHVDKYGTVLKNINDGDNHVYEHDEAKTTADVDKNYSAKNTGAGGKDIGELGGKIDVSTILKNDLDRDGKIAEGLTHNQWIGKVMPGGEWDLKANQNTVFGVAWNYDETLKTQTGIDQHTFFQFNGMQENGNFTAADVGNYHAGYTGIAAGMPQSAQYHWAGTGEIVKDLKNFNFSSAGHRLNEMIFNVSPNGDQKVDFHWNTQGMVDASKAGLHP